MVEPIAGDVHRKEKWEMALLDGPIVRRLPLQLINLPTEPLLFTLENQVTILSVLWLQMARRIVGGETECGRVNGENWEMMMLIQGILVFRLKWTKRLSALRLL